MEWIFSDISMGTVDHWPLGGAGCLCTGYGLLPVPTIALHCHLQDKTDVYSCNTSVITAITLIIIILKKNKSLFIQKKKNYSRLENAFKKKKKTSLNRGLLWWFPKLINIHTKRQQHIMSWTGERVVPLQCRWCVGRGCQGGMVHYKGAHTQVWGEGKAAYSHLLFGTLHDGIFFCSSESHRTTTYYRPNHMRCPAGGTGCYFFAGEKTKGVEKRDFFFLLC